MSSAPWKTKVWKVYNGRTGYFGNWKLQTDKRIKERKEEEEEDDDDDDDGDGDDDDGDDDDDV
jgi:hypothetical protein